MNSARLLTRLIPYIFEDPDWRSFFWSAIPSQQGPVPDAAENEKETVSILSLIRNTNENESFSRNCFLFCFLLFHRNHPPLNIVEIKNQYLWLYHYSMLFAICFSVLNLPWPQTKQEMEETKPKIYKISILANTYGQVV